MAPTKKENVTILQIEGLKKYFPVRRGFLQRSVGYVKAVDDVSLDIQSSETFGLVGESGCGKATVGRTILRLMEPTGGEAVFEGKNVFGMDARELRETRRRMQIIFQDPYSSLNPRMTVGSIIAEPWARHRHSL